MSAHCSSCGSSIPDGQGSSCSMCYGDVGHGSDGYYENWLREQIEAVDRALEQQQAEQTTPSGQDAKEEGR